MSAFVVNLIHIDAILSAALHGPRDFNPRRYPGWDKPDVGELIGRERERLDLMNASAAGAALLTGCITTPSWSSSPQRAAGPGDAEPRGTAPAA